MSFERYLCRCAACNQPDSWLFFAFGNCKNSRSWICKNKKSRSFRNRRLIFVNYSLSCGKRYYCDFEQVFCFGADGCALFWEKDCNWVYPSSYDFLYMQFYFFGFYWSNKPYYKKQCVFDKERHFIFWNFSGGNSCLCGGGLRCYGYFKKAFSPRRTGG